MIEINNPKQRLSIADQGLGSESAYIPIREEVHFRDYWKIVVKRRRFILLTILIALAVGGYTTFTATKMYTSTSMLKIEPQNPTVTGIGEMLRATSDGGGGPYDYFQTQFQLLQSRRLAAEVIRELNLESNKVFTETRITTSNAFERIKTWILAPLQFVVSRASALLTTSPRKSVVPGEADKADRRTNSANLDQRSEPTSRWEGRYLGFLRVNPIKNTRLVEVQFTTPDPGLSQELASGHAQGFIRSSLESRFELTQEARDFLDKKNADLKLKLERSERELNRFRQANNVVSMDRGENIVVERMVELNRQLTSARTRRIEAEALYKVVENKPQQYLAEVISQGMIPNLRSNLLALETEKLKLSSVFKPDHPRMIELNHQVNETRRALNNEIANVVKGIAENYAASSAREQALQTEAQKQQQMALNLKQVGVEYAVLEEEVKVNRALYESVLKRLNETYVSNDLAVTNIQIVQRGERPQDPSSPNAVFNLLLSGFFGVFLGVLLAFILEYLDSRLATPEHVWRAVALNTFGIVPNLDTLNQRLLKYRPSWTEIPIIRKLAPAHVDRSRSSVKELIVSHHPLSLINESYRTIRTALQFSQVEKPPQVILLTSPSPGEGKTVTTLNLGISLVQDGHRVLVIDADLRKGSCHARLGIKNHRGLSNVLTGSLRLEEVICETPVRGLSLLSHGVCPPNPSNLLASNKMRETLNSVRQSFDFILIDSPPVIAVSDAAVLASICDGVVLVFNGRKTTTASARQAIERLAAVRASVLGVVLNSVDLSNPDYAYYRHYYGSDYGSSSTSEIETAPVMDATAVDEPTEAATSAEVVAANDQIEPATLVEPVAVVENNKPAKLSKKGKSETVPSYFFDSMTAKLTEAAGPMAVLIIRDQMLLLGESQDAFPKDRLRELLAGVCKEILSEDLKRKFNNAVAEEIRAL